jgi:hypothetical protein
MTVWKRPLGDTGAAGLICILAGSGRIRGLSAGQSMISYFVVIFWLDGDSFNQSGVQRRFHVPKPAPWPGSSRSRV